MKKLIVTIFLACFWIYTLSANAQNVTTPKAINPEEKLPNNIVGGLFIGISGIRGKMNNSLEFNPDLKTYGVSNREEVQRNSSEIKSFGFEGKLGLMKTFSNIGIRIYGYYGMSFGEFDTLGIKPTVSLKPYIETAFLDTRYYGGIAELMIGSFQSQEVNFYFIAGGGYQFTDYSMSGTISVADEMTSPNYKADLYHAGNRAKTFKYESPLVSLGVGMIFNQHHMFEFGLRYLFNNPYMLASSRLTYDITRYTVTPGTHSYDENDSVNIKNNLTDHFRVSLSYIFLF